MHTDIIFGSTTFFCVPLFLCGRIERDFIFEISKPFLWRANISRLVWTVENLLKTKSLLLFDEEKFCSRRRMVATEWGAASCCDYSKKCFNERICPLANSAINFPRKICCPTVQYCTAQIECDKCLSALIHYRRFGFICRQFDLIFW